MLAINVHPRIYSILSVFRFMRLWTDGESGAYDLGRKLVLLTAMAYYPTSLLIGAYKTNNPDEARFSYCGSIVVVNLTVRLYYILWKKEEILELISQIGSSSFKSLEEFYRVNNRTNLFMKFGSGMLVMNFGTNIALIILKLPIFTIEKQLPVTFYFPFDWENSEVRFWMVYAFVSYEMMISSACTLLNVVIWYLMMSSAMKYETMGEEFRIIGYRKTDGETNLFKDELMSLIERHRNLEETTKKLRVCFSNLFFIQIATSGLGICFSIFALVFNSYENYIDFLVYGVILVYNIFDIFMVMCFGNEIKLSSGHLLYCLFECNWSEQSECCKKYVLMLMEFFEKPQELVIGKLFPLNYQTFTSIINFAYSVFNILKNLK